MSLVKSKAIQLGFDATPTNNFLIYQPLTPDGTFRIANGNQGATTDIMTVTSGGSVTFAGTTNFSSLNFSAGSESAPSLFPTGDSNTGIWFPAADTFAVSTGGSERLRISAAGKTTLSGALATTGFDLTASTNPYFTKPTAYSLSFDNAGGLNSANPYWLGYQFASPIITQSGTNLFPRASHFYSYTSAADPTDLTYNVWLGNSSTINQNMVLMAGNAGGYMAFGTSSTERLRIDSTGNVGIGLTNPSYKLHVSGGSASRADIQVSYDGIGNTSNDGAQFGIQSAGAYIWNFENSDLYFGTNNTAKARITSSGDMLVGIQSQLTIGTLNPGRLCVDTGSGASSYNAIKAKVNGVSQIILASTSSVDGYYLAYPTNAAGAAVGNIRVEVDGVTYNTTSDYRLKIKVEPIENASDRLMKLRPVRHGWTTSSSIVDGFIAHEVQEAGFEYAVTGEKDGAEIQSMDYGRITPVIVAALQDALKEIEALKQEVQSLKEIK